MQDVGNDSSSDNDSVCSTETSAEVKDSCTLYVGKGFPSYIREQQIRDHFAALGFGDFITNVVVPVDKASGSTKGFGFVTFTSPKAAEDAISIVNGTSILDKYKVQAKAYKRKKRPQHPRKKPQVPNPPYEEPHPPYGGPHPPYGGPQGVLNQSYGGPQGVLNQPYGGPHTPYGGPQGVPNPPYGGPRGVPNPPYGRPQRVPNQSYGGPQGVPNLPYGGPQRVPNPPYGGPQGVPNPPYGGPQGVPNPPYGVPQGVPNPTSTVGNPSGTQLGQGVIDVYVGSDIPNHIKNDHIRAHFKDYNAFITNAMVVRDPPTKKTKGYAIVTFSSVDAAHDAIRKLNGSLLHGKFLLVVEEAQKHSVNNVVSMVTTPANGQVPPAVSSQTSASIIISNLPSSVSEESIGLLLGGIQHKSCHIDSEASKAVLELFSVDDARAAVSKLDGITLLGQVINVSVGKPPGPGKQRGGKPRSAKGEQTKYHPGGQGADPSLSGTGPHPPYGGPQGMAFDPNTSELGVQIHNMSLGGGQRKDNPKATKGPGAKSRRPGHKVPSYDTGAQEFPPYQNPEVLETTQQPLPSRSISPFHTSDEIPLTADQWNQLLVVDSHGNSLYGELTLPFKGNPNISIQPVMDKQGILITGTPEAVQAAKEHIGRALEKQLSVDKNKLAVLIQLCPNLHSEIQKKHSVTVAGYEQGSNTISFSNGSSSAVRCARQMFQERLQQVAVDDIPLPCVELVTSAKKRLEREGIQVMVIEDGMALQICSLGREELERALIIVRGKPFEDSVEIPPTAAEAISRDRNDLQESFAVHINVSGGTVFIRGFVKEGVSAACQCVRKMIASALIKREPLSCTPEQHIYLGKVLINEPTKQGKALVSSLPAEVTFVKGKISLVGSPEAVQQSREEILRSDIFSRLRLWKTFAFTCSIAFISQIEQFVLKQLEDKLDCTYYVPADTQRKPAGKKGAPMTKENKGFSITVFSGTPDHFSQICAQLEGISPCSKHHPLRQGATDLAVTIAREMEAKYRARVKVKTQGKGLVVIHALHDSDAQECWAAMEESINSKLVIGKCIRLAQNQVLYLEIKHKKKLDNMKASCESMFVPSIRFLSNEVPLVKLRGTVSQVATVEEQLSELLDGFVEEEFEVDTTMYRMWVKRWRQLREDWDDIVLLFDQKAPDQSKKPFNPSDVTTVSFVVCGCDLEGIQRVKNMILTQESGNSVQTKILELPPNGAVALLKGLKEKQLDTKNIVAEMDIHKASNTVTITSPKMASDDIIKMEKVILSYVGDHSLKTETVTLTDPIIGLILTAQKYRYGDQLNDITNPRNVRHVIPKYPCGELTLIGRQSEVESAMLGVQDIMKNIMAIIGQIAVPISSRFASILNSKVFTVFCSQLQAELCVVCTPPQGEIDSSQTIAMTSPDSIYTLKGPQDGLEVAKDRILKRLDSLFSSKVIPMPFGECSALVRKLQEIAQRHSVSICIAEQVPKPGGKGGKILKLEGAKQTVEKVCNQVQEEIINYQASAEDADLPPEWQKPQSKTTELFHLTDGTECIKVAHKFLQTMPQAKITSVQRIQNTWLWDRYVKHRERLHLKNNGQVNEIELFHGTRNNDPKLIYDSEDGFDMRYSAQGMWGVANYFAVNASYSHNYAHVNTTTGLREMFLVKVLTGESYQCAPNSSLRMPPPKPSAGPSSQLQFGQMKYDTVTGNTHGSQVYMAYDNEKAYPAYLIQYQI